MKKLMLVIALASLTLGMQAQTKKVMEEKPTAGQRMASQLMLDDKTAAKFIPLYNEFRQKMKEAVKTDKPAKHVSDMTDAEVESLLKQRFERSQKLLDVREAYFKKFQGVLTARQIYKIYQSEGRHGTQLRNRMQRFHRPGPVAPKKLRVKKGLPHSFKLDAKTDSVK